MSILQKTVKSMLPEKFFSKTEEESKKWYIKCNQCGHTVSCWEAGGLRAWATPRKKMRGRCPHCNKWKFLDVVKKI